MNVVWDCGQEFKNLVADAEFNLVASRSAQAALLKAIKSGSSVVELDASTNSGGSDDPEGGDTPNGGGSDPAGPSTGGSEQGGSGSSGSGEVEQIFIGTSVNDEAMGTVTGMGSYDKGESVTLVARANDGYRFIQWTDDVLDNPRTVTADVNGVIYTAVFEEEA